MKGFLFLSFLAVLLFAGPGPAKEKTFLITITAGKHDYRNTPVTIPLSLPKELAQENPVALETKGSLNGPDMGQLTAPGILTENVPPSAANLVRRDLHFIVPHLPAGK